jgi:hypothetical protein
MIRPPHGLSLKGTLTNTAAVASDVLETTVRPAYHRYMAGPTHSAVAS